jgi:hypothetical protein
MRTRIISAFPGTGKSFSHHLRPLTSLDSDSSLFSWGSDVGGQKIRNPNFPNNYVQHIKDNIGKVEFIFVSSHREVREALLDNCIFFYLIYPDRSDKTKAIYLERFRNRGSPQSFIDRVSQNWESWIKECSFCQTGCSNICMCLGTLEAELRHIVRSEGGDFQPELHRPCVDERYP